MFCFFVNINIKYLKVVQGIVRTNLPLTFNIMQEKRLANLLSIFYLSTSPIWQNSWSFIIEYRGIQRAFVISMYDREFVIKQKKYNFKYFL